MKVEDIILGIIKDHPKITLLQSGESYGSPNWNIQANSSLPASEIEAALKDKGVNVFWIRESNDSYRLRYGRRTQTGYIVVTPISI